MRCARPPALQPPRQSPLLGELEKLWRDDHVYDIIVELAHNDDPVVAGLGSAIFMHIAKPDYTPTEGCIAVAQEDMLSILSQAGPGSVLEIKA